MAEGDDEEKTEEPTDKRLSDAFKEGDVPQSQEAKVLAGLLAILCIVVLMSAGIMDTLGTALLPFLSRPQDMLTDLSGLTLIVEEVGWAVLKSLALPFTLIVALGIAMSAAQIKGILFVPKKLIPDLSKISPLKGLTRIFSMNQLMEVTKQILKLVIVGTVIFVIIFNNVKEYEGLPQLPVAGMLAFIKDQMYWMIVATIFMMIVLAAADYAFQHWKWKEKLKMTQQQVKEEHKQQEGDPQVKARIRALRNQKARQRMMAAVPTADVVVTNPTHYAVALKYDGETMGAPTLVAKGMDNVALRIREVAKEHDVPIVENPPLARALYATVDLDREVPPEHYKAVAEVISYIMKLKGKTKESMGGGGRR